jgi:protein TonB
MSAAAMSSYAAPRLSRQGLVVVIALHGAALWALTQMELISLPAPLAVLSVSLLPAAETPPQPPALEPPRPRPVAKKPPPPVAPPTPIALPVEAPVVPVFEAPAPPVEAPPPPPAAVAPTPTPAPPPMAEPTPPRFDANYRDNPKPVYPALSRRLGEEGRVVLRVRVGPDGLPLAVELHTSSGSTRLDATAIDTVRRWKFVPARRGSEAIAASVLVPIVFSLKE